MELGCVTLSAFGYVSSVKYPILCYYFISLYSNKCFPELCELFNKLLSIISSQAPGRDIKYISYTTNCFTMTYKNLAQKLTVYTQQLKLKYLEENIAEDIVKWG